MDFNYNNQVINQQRFYQGQSVDKKLGAAASFQYSRGLDWRKNPSQLVQAMQPRRIDDGNLPDMIVHIVQTPTGERFGIGKEGHFYLIDSNNDIVELGSIGENSGHGMVYFQPTDTIYISGQKNIHKFSPVSDTATRKLTRDYLASSLSTNTTGSFPSIRTGGVNTYAVPTSYTENDTNRLKFTMDIEPLTGIILDVADKGTGDWTIEIHDPTERVMATKTIVAADMENEEVEFTIDPTELLVKPNAMIYHAHVKVSTGTGTIRCATANDLNTANFELRADRMVATNNGYHPMAHFLQYLAVQNGRYLSVWEPLSDAPDNSEYKRHRLTYPDGYEGCGIDSTDEYLIQALEKRSTDNEREFQEGLLAFWDGLTGSYNFYIRIKEGAPEAMYVKDNVPHFIIGGTLYVWLGGKTLTKVRDLPNIDNDFTGVKDITHAYPNVMTSFKKLLHIGYPSVTANENLEFGVYNFGTASADFNPSFGYQYALSHQQINRTDASELEIGCLQAFGDEMYISWRKGTEYGLDVVDSNCAVAPYFKWLALKFDAQNVHKQKGANKIVVTTSAIPAGTELYLIYTADDGTEQVITSPGTTGETQVVFTIDGLRYNELDYGFYGTSESDVTTPLVIKGVALEWDPFRDEDMMNAE